MIRDRVSEGVTILFLLVAFIAIVKLYREVMGYPHHPDTLRIRCEDELKGVLVGDNCFKKEAVYWTEKEAPR